MSMGIIAWVILGALAGWVASIITGNNARMGCLANIIIGIIGAFIGGFLMNMFGGSGITGFNLYSLFVSILGAVVLLFVVSLIRGR
jgi:uncharacterized membrane protein YeaQ/YmgE (transglycosylase-associated protein family)